MTLLNERAPSPRGTDSGRGEVTQCPPREASSTDTLKYKPQAPETQVESAPADGCDSNEARMFLQLLDPRAVQFCFQTFDDSAGKDARLARTLHGTLEERFRELEGLNKRGAGVFVTVNEVDGKARTAENIVRVRAVFADFDPPKTRVAGQTAYPRSPEL